MIAPNAAAGRCRRTDAAAIVRWRESESDETCVIAIRLHQPAASSSSPPSLMGMSAWKTPWMRSSSSPLPPSTARRRHRDVARKRPDPHLRPPTISGAAFEITRRRHRPVRTTPSAQRAVSGGGLNGIEVRRIDMFTKLWPIPYLCAVISLTTLGRIRRARNEESKRGKKK